MSNTEKQAISVVVEISEDAYNRLVAEAERLTDIDIYQLMAKKLAAPTVAKPAV